MSSISITMFGEFSVSYRDKTIKESDRRGSKMWQLLQYLIAHREREIPQNELIELLWSEKSENPVNALKTLIHRTRRILFEVLPDKAELIINCRGSYRLNPDLDIYIDSGEFVRLCQMGDNESLSRTKRVHIYKSAISLYSGGYLTSISGEAWVIPLNVYFHSMYAACVDKYVKLLFPMGKFTDIIDACEHAIVINPTDEKMHIHLIRALVAMGEYDLAAQQYSYIKNLLFEQYGAAPSSRLTELYEMTVKPRNEAGRSLDVVMGDLAEENLFNGGYFCEYEVFKYIYRLHYREAVRLKKKLVMCLVTIVTDKGDVNDEKKVLAKIMSKLADCVGVSLRKSDVYTRFSRCQFLIMLPDTDNSVCERIETRILAKFNHRRSVKQDVQLKFSFRMVDGANS